MEYSINGKQFSYIFNYKEDKDIRDSFNTLTQKVYGFSFEKWFQDGRWKDAYIPYSLLYKNVVVANVSINLIDFDVFGQKKRYIQIGTVMTDPEFRNMGLSRFLMEKIMEAWHGRFDMLYLFANDSVLDFYPKFGFEKAIEYQLSKKLKYIQPTMSAEKIDMTDNAKRQALVERICETKIISSLAMENNIGLIMFYCTSFMKENVYYISKYDAYVVAEFHNDTLYLQDLFCEAYVELDDIFAAMATDAIKEVVLGFTPSNKNGFEECVLNEDNSTLFVLGKDVEQFRYNRIMFPVLSHA